MGLQVVRDSDEEASDEGFEPHEPVSGPSPSKQVTGHVERSFRELRPGHANMLGDEVEDLSQGKGTKNSHDGQHSTLTIATSLDTQPITPSTSLREHTPTASTSHATLVTSETVGSDQTIRPEVEDVDAESQKRKADVDAIDEDEVCFVPARKRQRGERARPDQPVSTQASDRVSMPPPSQESIAGRVSAMSQRSAARAQPSPPRLADDMSFTTTNSSATSFQGDRGARMFPSLYSDSFQQRINDMNLSQQTEPDSMPPSQNEPTFASRGPVIQQESSDQDLMFAMSMPSASSDESTQSRGQLAQERYQANREPDRNSSTLIRVEVPLLQTESVNSSQHSFSVEMQDSQRSTDLGERPHSPIAEGDLADAEENAAEETPKAKSKQKPKSSKGKKAAKKRGRPVSKATSVVEDSDRDDEIEREKRNASIATSIDSNNGIENQESLPVSNATSFVANTPSPEAPDGVPETTPGTPDKLSDSSRSGKHSPLNSGRVPLRVGLSKRAQIEPLLRTVRK